MSEKEEKAAEIASNKKAFMRKQLVKNAASEVQRIARKKQQGISDAETKALDTFLKVVSAAKVKIAEENAKTHAQAQKDLAAKKVKDAAAAKKKAAEEAAAAKKAK